eukprot:CFRG0589T1
MIKMLSKSVQCFLCATFVATAYAGSSCPHLAAQGDSQNSYHSTIGRGRSYHGLESFEDVKGDIKKALSDSKETWPADYGNYGPFMIRSAWHCSGSFRDSDGRGGCDGARIRFDPEGNWEDNANLDKARKILEPIKENYGDKLSWGDLIVLTGNVAIESMGGPVIGFCGGRLDDSNGTDSLQLGPSSEQEAISDCEVNGQCKFPLGQTTIGLIYVNPEGPMASPDPKGSAVKIRDSFGRMGMNDRETVALIGGGHAFGKSHGACKSPPCGSGAMKGKGPNTFTSGLEGPWTENPTKWDNTYFKTLLDLEWERYEGPGGRIQWKPTKDEHSIQMFTTDIALIHDDAYLALVKEYANDMDSLNKDFSEAWYKLVTRDMGPVSRCHGEDVPAARPFQNPLPESTSSLVDLEQVTKRIQDMLHSESDAMTPDVDSDGNPYYGALFVNLAWQCASTFRSTDYSGGCNGAGIRFSPQKDYKLNEGMDQVLNVLRPIKNEFPDLSWADLIVLAGQTALDDAGGDKMMFHAVRSDQPNGDNDAKLAPRDYYPKASVAVHDFMNVMGLTVEEMVALAGRLRSPTQQERLGFMGSYTKEPSILTNTYYIALLNNEWVPSSEDKNVYTSPGKDIYMLETDLVLIQVPEYKKIVEQYASDEALFKKKFADAWVTVMNADIFGEVHGDCKVREEL